MMSVMKMEKNNLDGLPAREISRRLMQMPTIKRVETILNSPDSAHVAASLAVQDFYVTVQEIGPDDSLPLLALATVPQLNFLFDIEWWEKEMVRPAAALGWLERLALAGEEKLGAWLYEADFELLVTLFKQWLIVAVLPEDTDLAEARETLPNQTLDGHYFWDPKYPQYEELLRRILSFLFEVNYGFYKELMNQIIWTLDTEMEDLAYRFHKGRLEDRAIPDFYEAVTIYRNVRSSDAELQAKTPMEEHAEQDGEWPPGFAVAQIHDDDLLSSVLRQIRDPRVLDSIQFELAALANKVVVADGALSEGSEALRRAVEKTMAYVGLGLEMKGNGDFQTALRLVQALFLEDLFRLAHSSVAWIKGRLLNLRQRGWLSQWPTGLRLLDAPWMERAELLLGKTPRCLRSGDDAPVKPREDFFRSRQDLLDGGRVVDIIEMAGELFHSVRIDPRELAGHLWPDGQIPDVESVTLGSLVWTAAARDILYGTWVADPLPIRDWRSIFARLAPAAIRDAVLAQTAVMAPGDEKRALLRDYLDPLFRACDEELSAFKENDPPDPAFTRFFLFSRE